MLRLLRIALLLVLTVFVISMIIGIGSPQTGPIEKVVLGLVTIGLFAVAVPVRRIGVSATR